MLQTESERLNKEKENLELKESIAHLKKQLKNREKELTNYTMAESRFAVPLFELSCSVEGFHLRLLFRREKNLRHYLSPYAIPS